MVGSKDRARLFSAVSSNRTGQEATDTKHRGFHLKVKNAHVLTVRATESQNTFSVFGDIQTPNGHSPEQPALADPALSKGVRVGISRGAFQPQPLGNSQESRAAQLKPVSSCSSDHIRLVDISEFFATAPFLCSVFLAHCFVFCQLRN